MIARKCVRFLKRNLDSRGKNNNNCVMQVFVNTPMVIGVKVDYKCSFKLFQEEIIGKDF